MLVPFFFKVYMLHGVSQVLLLRAYQRGQNVPVTISNKSHYEVTGRPLNHCFSSTSSFPVLLLQPYNHQAVSPALCLLFCVLSLGQVTASWGLFLCCLCQAIEPHRGRLCGRQQQGGEVFMEVKYIYLKVQRITFCKRRLMCYFPRG